MMASRKERVVKKLNVALIGYKFMGKAHSYALLATPFFFKTGIEPVRKVLVGRHAGPLQQAAAGFRLGGIRDGLARSGTAARHRCRSTSPRPPIRMPRLRSRRPRRASTSSAKSRSRSPSKRRSGHLAAVQRAGVKHMLGFNYRRVPAIGLAKRLIESGRLGKIFHFRAAYLQDWIMDPQFPRIWKLNKAIAGSGPHHELNSHIIDLALYLVGKINRVVGMEETFIKQRPAEAESEQLSTMLTAQAGSSQLVDVDVDDTTAFLARFADGAVGTFESTRFAAGRRNHNRIEVNGSKGSVYFDLENMNLLEYYNAEDPADVPGFRTIQVNEGCHPYIDHWWPPGHGIGYQNTFVNQFADFFQAIANDTTPQPGFEVGLENQKVLEAVTKSIAAERWVAVSL